MITIRWACGHETPVTSDEPPKACPVCGERRRVRVHAPPPRFTGAVTGPSATPTPIAPMAEKFQGGES